MAEQQHEGRNKLQEYVDKANEQARLAEEQKKAKTKLDELAGVVNTEEQAYRSELPGFRATWEQHDAEIIKIKARIEGLPQLELCHQTICQEVISPLWTMRHKIKEAYGKPDWDLHEAEERLAGATGHVDAWKTLSRWVKGRLDRNQQLINEICKLDNCKDSFFAVYIFYYELYPAHWLLNHRPAGIVPEPDGSDSAARHRHRDADDNKRFFFPDQVYCESSDRCQMSYVKDDKERVELYYAPWLLEPEEYNCMLAASWTVWRDVCREHAKCKAAVDTIRATKQKYEHDRNPAVKREAARHALRLKSDNVGKKASMHPRAEA